MFEHGGHESRALVTRPVFRNTLHRDDFLFLIQEGSTRWCIGHEEKHECVTGNGEGSEGLAMKTFRLLNEEAINRLLTRKINAQLGTADRVTCPNP